MDGAGGSQFVTNTIQLTRLPKLRPVREGKTPALLHPRRHPTGQLPLCPRSQ